MRQPVFLINGPPRSGKDTLANHISKTVPGFRVVKFARILKERTHALYGVGGLSHDYFEETKDVPNPIFLGITPRQAYINVSERYMKPLHGEEVFGNLLLDEMSHDNEAQGFLISDSGFSIEALPIIRFFGLDNCVLVRVHADGRGCSFSGDSRSYITLPIETIDVHNDTTEDCFLNAGSYRLTQIIQSIIGGR